MACCNKTQSRSGPKACQPRTTKAPGSCLARSRPSSSHAPSSLHPSFYPSPARFFPSHVHALFLPSAPRPHPFSPFRGGRPEGKKREFVAVFFIATILCLLLHCETLADSSADSTPRRGCLVQKFTSLAQSGLGSARLGQICEMEMDKWYRGAMGAGICRASIGSQCNGAHIMLLPIS